MMKFIQNRRGPNAISIDCINNYDCPSRINKSNCPLDKRINTIIWLNRSVIDIPDNRLANISYVGIKFLGQNRANIERDIK